MQTKHKVFFKNANQMSELSDGSVHLIVTSPPYPMIEMWDHTFMAQNDNISEQLSNGHGFKAFELMHKCLDIVWKEIYRVLCDGGIACINIGDATRTINGDFILFPNHSRILSQLIHIGFSPLPLIIWRKQTNAPNKFMGSGMLPPGAYVTLEHEYILIARKNGKRLFKNTNDKEIRHQSAFFWEERNNWFSDVWFELKGTRQNMNDNDPRKRSAAFPFDLAYRLVNMFSVEDDIVLDPFLGSGTTLLACMASMRNSFGYEIDIGFKDIIEGKLDGFIDIANNYIDGRLSNHINFVKDRFRDKGFFQYANEIYGFPVITRQELKMRLCKLTNLTKEQDSFIADYTLDSIGNQNWSEFLGEKQKDDKTRKIKTSKKTPMTNNQLKLFE
jgi:DNA modification methylase